MAEGNGNALILDDKVTAVKEIIRDRLANNFPGGGNYTGDVYALNQMGGCDGTVAQATNPAIDPHCLKFPIANASWPTLRLVDVPRATGGGNCLTFRS